MTRTLVAIFAIGLAAMIAGGMNWGFDAMTLLLLVLAFGVALVGIAVARKFSTGAVEPAQCPECGGVIAPSSPYCKHCGARRQT